MAQLNVTANGIDIASSYQYSVPPDWQAIKGDGIEWVCHKATEGMGYRDKYFPDFWTGPSLTFRYRGAYGWPRTDSGTFADQCAVLADHVRGQRQTLRGDFLMIDVERTGSLRSWTDDEVANGMDAIIRYWGGPVLLYGRVLGGYDLVYADWTTHPNVPGTVVRQLGGRTISGIRSNSSPDVDTDYIVDRERMDIVAGYTPNPNPVKDLNDMWIANCDGDYFLVGTCSMPITLWDISNNPDVTALIAGHVKADGSPDIDAVAIVPDADKQARIRAMDAELFSVNMHGTPAGYPTAQVIAAAVRAQFSAQPLTIQTTGQSSGLAS